MKGMLYVVVVVALLSSPALADDLIPPPWYRDVAGVTYAEWDGWGLPAGPNDGFLADVEWNLYGDAEAVESSGQTLVWRSITTRLNVLEVPVGNQLCLHLPNEQHTYRDLYLQITWYAGGDRCAPVVTYPETGAVVTLDTELELSGGWWYARFHIHVEPAAEREVLCFDAPTLGMFVDQIVVDTGNPPALGACCTLDGACHETAEWECNGMWHGPGSNCDPSPCEAIGACCRFDGTCYERPEHMCRGQWLGEGVSCTPNPCPSGVCVGDANCDALINWHDIDYFVAAMNNNIAAWEAMFLPGAPLCAFTNNDVNRDAMVDWRDIDPLIEVMDTSCPW